MAGEHHAPRSYGRMDGVCHVCADRMHVWEIPQNAVSVSHICVLFKMQRYFECSWSLLRWILTLTHHVSIPVAHHSTPRSGNTNIRETRHWLRSLHLNPLSISNVEVQECACRLLTTTYHSLLRLPVAWFRSKSLKMSSRNLNESFFGNENVGWESARLINRTFRQLLQFSPRNSGRGQSFKPTHMWLHCPLHASCRERTSGFSIIFQRRSDSIGVESNERAVPGTIKSFEY